MCLQIAQNLLAMLLFFSIFAPYSVHQILPLHLVNKHREGHLCLTKFTLNKVFKELCDPLVHRVTIWLLDDPQELWEFDLAWLVVVNRHDHLFNLPDILRETQTDERVLQLVNTDWTTTVCVKSHKILLQLF